MCTSSHLLSTPGTHPPPDPPPSPPFQHDVICECSVLQSLKKQFVYLKGLNLDVHYWTHRQPSPLIFLLFFLLLLVIKASTNLIFNLSLLSNHDCMLLSFEVQHMRRQYTTHSTHIYIHTQYIYTHIYTQYTYIHNTYIYSTYRQYTSAYWTLPQSFP